MQDGTDSWRSHPTGFWFVFWGELAERASFYGMRTLLALYLLEVLNFEAASGAAVMQFFLAACYLAPLLGGLIADRFLGRFRTIALFALPYLAGHLVLGFVPSRTGLFVALALLALGSGAIKPNTSTLMGMIYEDQKKTRLLGQAFSWFYAAINVGAAVSSLGLPLVRDRYGYAFALAIPAALMTVAFALFVAGRRHYPSEDVRARAPSTPADRATERASLERLAGVFGLIAVFWFIYDQSASTWIFFARDHMNLELGAGLSVTPDQIQGLNPIFILALTPAFNALWRAFARRGSPLPDLEKMRAGFAIVVVAMTAMAIAGAFASGGAKVSAWWEILATFVITLAELCVSVVGLEYAYKSASPRAKSAVTAAFLLTVFVGDLFGGLFDQLYGKISPGAYFALQAVLAFLAFLAFGRVARSAERGRQGGMQGGIVADSSLGLTTGHDKG